MPTCGNTVQGTVDSGNFANGFIATFGKHNLPVPAIVSDMSFYTTSARTMILCIYADNAGVPGALEAQSAPFTSVAGGWSNASMSNAAVPAGDKWLGFHHTGGNANYKLVSNDSYTRKWKAATYTGTAPDPYPSSPSSSPSQNASIYFTYTEDVDTEHFIALPGRLELRGIAATLDDGSIVEHLDALPGRIEIRPGTARLSLGKGFLIQGQSNGQGQGINANETFSHPTKFGSKFTQADLWSRGQDPFSSTSGGASCWSYVMNNLLYRLDKHVSFITTAQNGAALSTNWGAGQSSYLASLAQLDDSKVEECLAQLFIGCESDVGLSVLIKENLGSLSARSRADRPSVLGSCPLVVSNIGMYSAKADADLNAARLQIMAAWDDMTGDYANIFAGGSFHDVDLSVATGNDALHYKTQVVRQIQGRRIYLGLEEALGLGTNGRGPRLLSAKINPVFDASILDLYLDRVIRSDITSFEPTAFRVEDSGSPVAVSAATRFAPQRVRLQLAAAIVGTPTITFGFGEDAIGVDIPWGEQITLPDGTTVYQPLEIFTDHAVDIDTTEHFTASPGRLELRGRDANLTVGEPAAGIRRIGMATFNPVQVF